MDSRRTSLMPVMFFCILVLSGILFHRELEARAIFLMRGGILLTLFVWILVYSPNIFKPYRNEGESLIPAVWGVLGIIGGILVARAVLFLEFQGGSNGRDLISLTIFYSVSIIMLAQPIASILKKGIMITGNDRLEKGVFSIDHYEKRLRGDDSVILDQRGEIVAKRLRNNILSIIDHDTEIGSSGNKEIYIQGSWLWTEMSGFADRNNLHLPQKLTGDDETKKFSNIDLRDYLSREVSKEFENRLLKNLAQGTKSFSSAREGNVILAKNLILQLGLYDEFSDQKIELENAEALLLRQMAVFMHIFSEVFARSVGRDDTEKTIGMAEGKMIVRGLMKYLIEKNAEITDTPEYIQEEKYKAIDRPSLPRIEGETAKDINHLLEKMPLLDLGINRLDHGINRQDSIGGDGPLESFVSACLDFFHENDAK